MTRHLDLLATLPAPPRRPPAIGAGAALATVALVAACGAAFVHWSLQRTEQLQERARQLAGPVDRAPAAGRLDPVVLRELAQQLEQRQALLAAFTGQVGDTDDDAGRPSAWLGALASLAGNGIALDSIRLEPGARLAVAGTAAAPTDIHAWLTRLQQHPLTGRSALAQLELKAGEGAGAPITFRLAPPAPSTDAAAPRGTAQPAGPPAAATAAP